MIERILPRGVEVVAVREDPADVELFPAERAHVARAVDKRRREFATVRYCARRALAALGEAPVPLLPDDRGAPRWPPGVSGSMTHCAGFRAAAVASNRLFSAIGIDAEPAEQLPDGVLDVVSSPVERAAIASLEASGHDAIPWGRLLFSAKESVFKAWYPLARRELDFREAELTFTPGGGFHARLLVTGPVVDGRPVVGYRGRWLVTDGLALTAVAVPRPG